MDYNDWLQYVGAQKVLAGGDELSYFHLPGFDVSVGRDAGIGRPFPVEVVFFHGFYSDMGGEKVQRLVKECKRLGCGFTAFEYFGHGSSAGTISDGSIGRWLNNCLGILDQYIKKPVIVMGSSMGGWLGLLAAMHRPEKVRGFIGFASAPDFTHRSIIANMTPKQKQDLEEKGFFMRQTSYSAPYPISQKFLDEAENHLIMGSKITLDIPVHLLHGTMDDVVPWQEAIALSDNLNTKDVKITLIKGSDHRLSAPGDLEFLALALEGMLSSFKERS